MARFARDRRFVEAIIDGVDAMLHTNRSYDSHDLIAWLNANRSTQLNELYDLYLDCNDPETTANQQIGKYLFTLGQIKIGEQVSARRIDRSGGVTVNGSDTVTIWEASERAREGLNATKETLFGRDGFFDRVERESPVSSTNDWLDRMTGMFANDPVFAEMVRLGREYRESTRLNDDEP